VVTGHLPVGVDLLAGLTPALAEAGVIESQHRETGSDEIPGEVIEPQFFHTGESCAITMAGAGTSTGS